MANRGRVAAAKAAVVLAKPYFDTHPPTSDRALWARKHHTDYSVAWAAREYPAALDAAQAYRATLTSMPNITLAEQHSSLLVLAEALSRVGRLKEASSAYQQATASPFLPEAIGSHAWAFTKCRQSLQELQSGELEASQTSLDEAMAVFAKMPQKEPNLAYDLEVGQAYIHELKGRLKEAAAAYAKATDAAVLAHGPQSPMTHQVRSNAAYMLSYLRQPQQALAARAAAQEWAIEHAKKQGVGGQPPRHATAEVSPCAVMTELGRPQEALDTLRSLSAKDLAEEDAAPGWNARLTAETLRAQMAVEPSSEVRAEFARAQAALKKEGTPDWVVKRYERRR